VHHAKAQSPVASKGKQDVSSASSTVVHLNNGSITDKNVPCDDHRGCNSVISHSVKSACSFASSECKAINSNEPSNFSAKRRCLQETFHA